MSDMVDPSGVSLAPGSRANLDVPVATRGRALLPLVLLRFLVRRALWFAIKLIQTVWRHPISTLALVLLLYGGYRGYVRFLAQQSPAPVAAHFDIAPVIPPAPAVAGYVTAERNLDADGMWAAFSAVTQQSNISQGNSLDTLRQATDLFKQQGLRVSDVRYVGGTAVGSGRVYYFYVVTIQNAAGQQVPISQVFLIDGSQKIVQVTPMLQQLLQ